MALSFHGKIQGPQSSQTMLAGTRDDSIARGQDMGPGGCHGQWEAKKELLFVVKVLRSSVVESDFWRMAGDPTLLSCSYHVVWHWRMEWCQGPRDGAIAASSLWTSVTFGTFIPWEDPGPTAQSNHAGWRQRA